MSVDTVVDLRQQAGDLARRLGSLHLFISAAQELLGIVRRLNSEILQRHNRKIVTLVEISRTTLTRAGVKLHLFTSCSPALENYKSLYFDILRALRDRQEVIIDGDNLKDRVSRLLMPLSTWLVIRRGDSSSASSSSAPGSPNTDMTPSPPLQAAALPTNADTRRHYELARPARPPEELMPPPPSLPRRFQQPSPSAAARGRPLLRVDNGASPGAVRMARTRIPRSLPLPRVELESENQPEVAPSVLAPRRTQRFGIFCTGAGISAGGHRRRGSVPRFAP
ncbi:hypothetical protein BC834DRAFT_861848 [Gloeopeniophorella convolvens]|nr:hypothetical protein BC834DRAFT_861848 [Gloeopeniophorella convolvens]